MDELELLKKDWKKQEDMLPRLSYKEIYQMILKKSSSIVRWIFIISILEFLLWASLDVVFRLNGVHTDTEVDMESFSLIASIISYTILLYFITRFYLNYKKIKVTDSAKVLMENIIKTRRTVRQYIWVNISFLVLAMVATMGYIILFTDEFKNQPIENQPPVWLVVVVTLFAALILIVIIALFYRVVYGIFTRRLKKNYEELEKLEI
jgi:small-conductance mechanosensitive channel